MTRYAIVHHKDKVLVVPDDKGGDMRINCFYLGHIEGAWKLAQAIEQDLFGKPKKARGFMS